MARITSLNDLTSRRICDALSRGVSRTAAAEAAMVSMTTLMNWLRRGRAEEPVFVEFLARVHEAEAKAEVEVTNALFDAAVGGHVGAQTVWLERRRPKEWAKTEASAAAIEDRSDALTDGGELEAAESIVAALKSKKTGT